MHSKIEMKFTSSTVDGLTLVAMELVCVLAINYKVANRLLILLALE